MTVGNGVSTGANATGAVVGVAVTTTYSVVGVATCAYCCGWALASTGAAAIAWYGSAGNGLP